ncbi:MAG: 4'-phosphopantetheinyl transferase superfamily protein [Pseudoflavonifractor sp.]|nr:4'-phosphopantetheinyl transferase superfamily protein [Pseudoflavonifractor sp.]
MTLTVGDVTIHIARFDEAIGHADESDIAVAAKTRSDNRRREILAGRGIVRMALGIDLVHDQYGAPATQTGNVNISLSHAREMIALAVSPRPVGIDIEFPRRQLVRVATKFLTQRELERYITLPQLLDAWTAKEAVFKAAGHPDMTISEVEMTDPVTATVRGQSFRLTHIRNGEATIAIASPL